MKEKRINVEKKNVYGICKFLDKAYFHAGYGGGLNVTDRIYDNGISFRTIENHFMKYSPIKYEVVIKNQRNFNKDSLNKLIKMARN